MRGGQKPESANEMMTKNELDQAVVDGLEVISGATGPIEWAPVWELNDQLDDRRAEVREGLRKKVSARKLRALRRAEIQAYEAWKKEWVRVGKAREWANQMVDALADHLAETAGWADLWSAEAIMDGEAMGYRLTAPSFSARLVPCKVGAYVYAYSDTWHESQEAAVKAALSAPSRVKIMTNSHTDPDDGPYEHKEGEGSSINEALKDCGRGSQVRITSRPRWAGEISHGVNRARDFIHRWEGPLRGFFGR